MNKILIVCKSVTNAQKIMNIIDNSGFWVSISRTPSDIKMKSCSYSVIIYQKDIEKIQKILYKKNIQPLNMYLYANNGTYHKFGGNNDLFW